MDNYETTHRFHAGSPAPEGTPPFMYDICKSILPKAKAVVNIGTCACYGGVQAAKPNPTAAKGVNECFADLGIKGINIPGCPPNPLNMGRRGKAQPRPNLLAA